MSFPLKRHQEKCGDTHLSAWLLEGGVGMGDGGGGGGGGMRDAGGVRVCGYGNYMYNTRDLTTWINGLGMMREYNNMCE